MATPKQIGTIAKIIRKSGRDIQALVKEAGLEVDREIDHASQLKDTQAADLIKIHGVFLMKNRKGKQ